MNNRALLSSLPELELVATDSKNIPATAPDPREQRGLEAHVLTNFDTIAKCGGGSNGGLSGFDDSRRHFICPSYGQN